MKKKMIGIFVCTLLLIATGITVAGTFKQSMEITQDASYIERGSTELGWYNPAGSWIRSDKKVTGTISPVGTGINRYSIISEHIYTDPKLYGLFPDAVAKTLDRGDLVKKGLNIYDTSLYGYAIDGDYNIEYYFVWSGTFEMTSWDTAKANFYGAYFGPDQDPFSEDPPLYCFGPYVFKYERIPIIPPCGS